MGGCWRLWLHLLLSLLITPQINSSNSSFPSSKQLCHSDESSALLQFKSVYFSTDYLFNSTNSWSKDEDCCTWSGITCERRTGHVTNIELSFGGLQGTLYSNSSLFSLGHLKVLDLSYNDFRGSSISPKFGGFVNMTHLLLARSNFSGRIPSNSSLFSLGHLKVLDLSFNDFRGSSISPKFGGFVNMTHLHLAFSNFRGRIPSEISHLSKLISLRLSSGAISFNPYERTTLDSLTMKRIAQNLTSLQVLSLSIVDMSSVAPISFINLSSSLTTLDLQFCDLHGKFPETLFHLPNLEELDLGENTNLTGSTPTSNWSSSPLDNLKLSRTRISIDLPFLTRNLKSMRFLSLRNCNFVGSHLEISGNLTQLMGLDLAENNFGGNIPWSQLNLEGLISLDLSFNKFVGELPEIHSNSTNTSSSLHDSSKNQLVGSIPMDLSMLILWSNSLNGTIPSWVYMLPSLEYLILKDNQFTGNIKMFQSLSLGQLDLSSNKFHGTIPSSIFAFQSLSLWILDLSTNKFHGTIPSSIFELVELEELDLSSNNLSGFLEFDKFKKLQSLTTLHLSYNHLRVSFHNLSNYALPNLDSLHMSSCNLTQFPYFLRASSNLSSLDLSDNQIQGNIPTWMLDVGRDSLSYFNLSRNFLTGSIEQFMWKNIVVLDLRTNMLEGRLPIPPPSTYFLSMSNNQLTGGLSSYICNLTSVKVIDLSNNYLSGKIPPCMGSFSQNLSVLDLQMNQFKGKIPSTFPKGNSLRNLNLHGNQLEGPLPQSLINCKMMEVLDLGDNKINDTFPNWLESLPSLHVLILRFNRLYGPISDPKTKLPFQSLRIMDLSHNQFGGRLPTKYFENLMAMKNTREDELKYMGEYYYEDNVVVVMKGNWVDLVKIQTMFITIDFSNNVFRGEIPRVIGELKSLKGLNLSFNKLTGEIPSTLGNLSNLEWLDISSNMLVGEIPKELAQVTSLAKLNLSRNQLVGPIPRGKQFDTFENDSYSGNSRLCGYPLTKSCSNKSYNPPTASTLDGDEDLNAFGWQVVWMGYGCGMVIGLSVGYIVFSIVMGRKLRSKMVKWWRKRSLTSVTVYLI